MLRNVNKKYLNARDNNVTQLNETIISMLPNVQCHVT